MRVCDNAGTSLGQLRRRLVHIHICLICFSFSERGVPCVGCDAQASRILAIQGRIRHRDRGCCCWPGAAGNHAGTPASCFEKDHEQYLSLREGGALTHDQFKKFPPYYGTYGPKKVTSFTFHVHLLPYVEEDAGHPSPVLSPTTIVPDYLSDLDSTRLGNAGGVCNFALNLRLYYTEGGLGELSAPPKLIYPPCRTRSQMEHRTRCYTPPSTRLAAQAVPCGWTPVTTLRTPLLRRRLARACSSGNRLPALRYAIRSRGRR